MICKNRKPNPLTGVAHGGVAIIYKEQNLMMKQIDFPNPDNFELVVAAGSLQGHSRKMLIIACYMPPNYTVDRSNRCIEYIYQIIVELKRRYKDPYIVLAGDFN